MRALFVICYSLFVISTAASAQQPAGQKPFEPVSGQAGKDVVWVPSPPDMVNKLMEMGQVTPNDFVIDLGSGDGRNVIAAAKLGARALGVEYNPDMVALSRKLAQDAGVAEKAQFVQADMYEYDISQATVMALFLLPVNMNRATAVELESVVLLLRKEAAALLAYRDKVGGFKTIDDIKKAPGIDFKKIEAAKDRITF